MTEQAVKKSDGNTYFQPMKRISQATFLPQYHFLYISCLVSATQLLIRCTYLHYNCLYGKTVHSGSYPKLELGYLLPAHQFHLHHHHIIGDKRALSVIPSNNLDCYLHPSQEGKGQVCQRPHFYPSPNQLKLMTMYGINFGCLKVHNQEYLGQKLNPRPYEFKIKDTATLPCA